MKSWNEKKNKNSQKGDNAKENQKRKKMSETNRTDENCDMKNEKWNIDFLFKQEVNFFEFNLFR